MDGIEDVLATDQQRRKFFALCKELGIAAEAGKEKAKTKYGLDSFADISRDQISDIIDKLEQKRETEVRQAIVAFFKTFPGSIWKESGSTLPYADWLAEKMTRYFFVKEKRD